MEENPVVLCDFCKKVIKKPTDGRAIQGEIYMVNVAAKEGETKCYGGLVGPAIPQEKDIFFSRKSIKESVFCVKCLLWVLQIDEQYFVQNYLTNLLKPKEEAVWYNE